MMEVVGTDGQRAVASIARKSAIRSKVFGTIQYNAATKVDP